MADPLSLRRGRSCTVKRDESSVRLWLLGQPRLSRPASRWSAPQWAGRPRSRDEGCEEIFGSHVRDSPSRCSTQVQSGRSMLVCHCTQALPRNRIMFCSREGRARSCAGQIPGSPPPSATPLSRTRRPLLGSLRLAGLPSLDRGGFQPCPVGSADRRVWIQSLVYLPGSSPCQPACHGARAGLAPCEEASTERGETDPLLLAVAIRPAGSQHRPVSYPIPLAGRRNPKLI